ncbi:MAG: glycosyltransferase family 4 protein [Candidatus Yanofskybacteria bacterium]|nr:glycosyltransferase family 4 protein [Candidatus Yanofskybacteria bacterium]
MNFTKSILITGDNYGSKVNDPFSYGRVLAQELSKNLKVYLSGSFLKMLKIAADVDAVFALSPLGSGYSGYISAGFRKKKFFIKIDDDYAWRAAIESGKTYFLASDFQKSKKTSRIAALHKRQIRLCHKAELVIVPSKFMSDVVHSWGIEQEKIKTISDPVNFSAVPISKEEARKKVAIPGNLLVSVGSLVPWNGFRMLIKLMPQISTINQFFRLIIIGDGPEYKTLKTMIKNMGLDKKVSLVGHKNQEELDLFLAASDMFVLNSGHEPFPNNVIKAMACGTPVITTAVGANTEIIKQGENGFMVRYNDEFNLIEAIKTVWQMPELRERFTEEGKKTAESFSLDKTIKETAKVINSKL